MTIETIVEKVQSLELTPQGKAYSSALAQSQVEYGEKGLKAQVNYILANAFARTEAGRKAKQYLDLWANNSQHEYCRICGTREASSFSKHNKEVCDACYEDVGEPKVCKGCGARSYEGDGVYTYIITDEGEKAELGEAGTALSDTIYMEEYELLDLEEEGKIVEEIQFFCEHCLSMR